jgi:large subunit ribosomal protein L3
MWQGLLGKKLGMTQIFMENGQRVGVTVVQAGPCPVLQVKAATGKDGYDAYQIGFDPGKESRATKPQIGHAKKHADTRPCRVVREVRVRAPVPDLEAGKVLTLADWADVTEVQVTGRSKGKGFQGVMKRYGFGGLRATHGVKTHHRIPGSSGSLTPARVVKGRKAPGHMGHVQVTTKGLRVVQIRTEENLILLEGAVPGPAGGYVLLRPAQPYRPD